MRKLLTTLCVAAEPLLTPTVTRPSAGVAHTQLPVPPVDKLQVMLELRRSTCSEDGAPAAKGAGHDDPPTSSSLPNSSRRTSSAGSPVGASTSTDKSAYVLSVTNALRLGGSTRPRDGSNAAPPGPASASGAVSDASVSRSGPESPEYAPRVS